MALANTGERFGYYTMIAILLLFLQAQFGFSTSTAGFIYSSFLALVYFMPMLGGIVADKWNFKKTVTLGIIIMFLGYLVMAISGLTSGSLALLFAALFLIACGTGLFKGNLQVMVGDLYNDPKYAHKRDVAFSLFYMAINIGAMFAPSVSEALCNLSLHSAGLEYQSGLPGLCNKFLADPQHMEAKSFVALMDATGITDFAALKAHCQTYVHAITKGYAYAFAVACASMVLSYLIYKIGASTFKHVGNNIKDKSNENAANVPELSKQETKSRIIALLLVFAVVIFFWMVFHQNGATLTKFAEIYTSQKGSGFTRIGFNVWALATIAIGVYAAFSFFQSESKKTKAISGLVLLASIVGVILFHIYTPNPVTGVQPQIYQQFNPFYVVALTPFSVALFGWLAKKGKEPSAPRKIGYGMIVAGIAYVVMIIASLGFGLPPKEGANETLVSPNWLISTYLVLTFAELLLSPMGISFVSKVAPPKYKGLMMGCWFGSTAVGNYLVSIPTALWDKISTPMLWGILMIICLVAAGFIFAIMKRLERVAK